MPKSFSFPVWLKGSPEEQKAEEERQKLIRASFTRAHMTEAERLVGRGKLLEETAHANLMSARDDNPEAIALAKAQLADALAMQGQYADAAIIHPDPVRTAHFEKIVTALEMPDEEKCACPDTEAKIGQQDIAVTPRFEEEKIFSPIHNDLVSVITCSKCGHSNARKARSRLLPQQAALNENEMAMRGKNPRMLSDAQVLAKHA